MLGTFAISELYRIASSHRDYPTTVVLKKLHTFQDEPKLVLRMAVQTTDDARLDEGAHNLYLAAYAAQHEHVDPARPNHVAVRRKYDPFSRSADRQDRLHSISVPKERSLSPTASRHLIRGVLGRLRSLISASSVAVSQRRTRKPLCSRRQTHPSRRQSGISQVRARVS